MARAAAGYKVKENQDNVHSLHPLGAGIKQLPDPDSRGLPPQHELSQPTDQILTALRPILATGLTASQPQIPSSSLKSSENILEHKPCTSPISGVSRSVRSSSPNPAVTPLSHICAFIVS